MQEKYASEGVHQRFETLNEIINNVWMVIMSVMIILSQIGYLMVETGTVKTLNSTDFLLKTLVVMAVSSLTFFLVGYGFARQADGGLMGQTHFTGMNYEFNDYSKWVYYNSLCVTMASIATGSIAERTSLDTYVFYTFLTSSLIFPLALAWCWEDGWLASLGFQDYAGAGIVHLTGGMTGFIGTCLCGPRIGLFSKDKKNMYILDEENFSSPDDNQDKKDTQKTVMRGEYED